MAWLHLARNPGLLFWSGFDHRSVAEDLACRTLRVSDLACLKADIDDGRSALAHGLFNHAHLSLAAGRFEYPLVALDLATDEILQPGPDVAAEVLRLDRVPAYQALGLENRVSGDRLGVYQQHG